MDMSKWLVTCILQLKTVFHFYFLKLCEKTNKQAEDE